MKTFIREEALRLGFQKVGFAAPNSLEKEAIHLTRWLKEGRQGTMDWLARRTEERGDPRVFYPPVKTVVSLAMNYYTIPPERSPGVPRWSNYAWGDDYHRLIKKRLRQLLASIQEAHTKVEGIVCVDTSPIMEKSWAQRAGIGWSGKHTNLITRDYGSWLFLGEILLNVKLAADLPFDRDYCGSCTACLDACPTGALTEAYEIDARRCISYLTIEYPGSFDKAQRNDLNGWIYGCDICQEVCPWNKRFAKPSPDRSFAPRDFVITYIGETWSGLKREDWDLLLRGSAARRPGYKGLLRNVRGAMSA
ncbi:tRNA epoxyqueuosine(34) reductase QueG [Candidatus Neomarinimicrobiota bacterium]